ncbi:MAG TPA: PadR family transcriptional regulator [Longimicrobiales bacterium]|nr:PadR family transcriptional regulator [Longimicrobiales bacterium]
MTRQDPASLLPLTPLSLGVLLALAEGPAHGYALLKELDRQIDGGLTPGTGTLYAALQRMIDEGLLEEVKRPRGEDARRRYYAVTPWGRRVARAELRRLAELMDAAGAKRLVPELRVAWRRRST